MRSFEYIVLVGVSALVLHCADQAMNGTTKPSRADNCSCAQDPPVFEKIHESTFAVQAEETAYETESIDVRAYREVVVRVNNPVYTSGGQPEMIDTVVPSFADTPEGPFWLSGTPILNTGGRFQTNGGYLRLKYASFNGNAFQVGYSIYGVK